MRKPKSLWEELPMTPRLRVGRGEAEQWLQEQIDKGRKFQNPQIADYAQMGEIEREFNKWLDYNKALLDKIFTPSKEFSFYETDYRGLKGVSDVHLQRQIEFFTSTVLRRISDLESIKERLSLYEKDIAATTPPADKVESAIERINLICDRFHHVARALRRRHNGRGTLDVTDEYDVQDLIHALLTLFFEDIREEEWTPSYAGGAARMDFLPKEEQVVIETKHTRAGLNPKRLGDELLIDIGRYREHRDCKALVCFVDDPDGRIPNPRGFENDLARQSTDKLRVIVLIRG